MDIKETIINECLNVLKKKEVKEEFKELMLPLIDMLIKYFCNYKFFINFRDFYTFITK